MGKAICDYIKMAAGDKGYRARIINSICNPPTNATSESGEISVILEWRSSLKNTNVHANNAYDCIGDCGGRC
jgi:hypothetical protein